jgi:hypothetical protein
MQMGGKSGGGGDMPSPREYIPLINAQAQANRVNTYTPYGSTVFSPVSRNSGGGSGGGSGTTHQASNSRMEDALGKLKPGSKASRAFSSSQITPTQSVTSFSPEVQKLFDQQMGIAGTSFGDSDFNREVENATFTRAMNLLEPGFQRQMSDFQQTMADRGLPVGGSAYDDEFANISRSQNKAREDAALSAVLAGKDVASRERGQRFNEMASILGQNQVAPSAPLDVTGAANMAMNNNMANAQARQGKKSSATNAGATLGAAYMMSDPRVKSNAVIVGEFMPGINIWEFNYIGDTERRTGFMSTEVKRIFPEAVVTRDDGYEMVNYGFFLNG